MSSWQIWKKKKHCFKSFCSPDYTWNYICCFVCFQMTEGRKCQILLPDERRLDFLIQVSMEWQVVQHWGHILKATQGKPAVRDNLNCNKTRVCKLIKGKAPRKHSLHKKTPASVLWKPFISSNEWCHTTDAPQRMTETPLSNVNNINVRSMIPEDQKNMTTQWCSTF